jgi:hypothetical protein
MKQTAVEWLEKEFVKLESTVGVHGVMYELIEQAKAMEKQQIIDAYKEGCFDSVLDESTDLSRAKQYYNQTFNK